MSLPARILAIALAVLVAFAAGWGVATRAAARDLLQSQLVAERGARVLAAQEVRRQNHVAAQYEAQAQRIRAQASTALPEVRNALYAPICAPVGASAPALVLADVPVPAAVLDGLRRAGADSRPD